VFTGWTTARSDGIPRADLRCVSLKNLIDRSESVNDPFDATIQSRASSISVWPLPRTRGCRA
jgi:hypothetical protein